MMRLTLILVSLLLFACKTDKTQEVLEDLTSGFVSHPVKVPKQDVQILSIGSSAPDFNLPGVDGKFHSLSEYKDANVLVVIFTCNHCPTAQAYEDRIISFTNEYKDKGVQVVAISPNSPLGLLHEELGYSDLGDTYEDMIVRADDMKFPFPYLYDGDNQKVSLAYGPAATPHTFVFDDQRKLRYVGRIDKSEKPGTANAEDLRKAVDQLIAGQPVSESVTKTFGCSTKWGWKTDMRTKIDAQWAEKDVTLNDISLKEISTLVANSSDKLRLVNIWATWCGPCRLEYPDFVVIQRMFGARDFEFVSLSTDKASQKDKAHEFLVNAHSALTNYISTTDDKYELIESIDPDWNGALPYTLLIEPGGNVIWREQGPVDFQELKRVIVEHPMIGRVY